MLSILAFRHFGILHPSISESIYQTFHAFQAPPFTFAILFLLLYSLLGGKIGLHLALVTCGIRLTSIFDKNRTFASGCIHHTLNCIALHLLLPVIFQSLVAPLHLNGMVFARLYTVCPGLDVDIEETTFGCFSAADCGRDAPDVRIN
jgi:hypothetical protein